MRGQVSVAFQRNRKRQVPGLQQPSQNGLQLPANLRHAREKCAMGSLPHVLESRQVNRGRPIADAKGA